MITQNQGNIFDFLKEKINNLPTAIFAGNDVIAYETIKILDDLGLKVPEDISVIGFDDTLIAKALKITSIKQPIEDISNIAFEMLMNKIKNKEQNKEIEQIALNPILFKRKTTKKINI